MVLHVFRPRVNGIIFMCAETYFFLFVSVWWLWDSSLFTQSYFFISATLLYCLAWFYHSYLPITHWWTFRLFPVFCSCTHSVRNSLALLLVRMSEGGGWENNRWVRGHVNLQLSQLLPYRLQSGCYQLAPASTWESTCSSTSSPNLEWSDCKVVANVM